MIDRETVHTLIDGVQIVLVAVLAFRFGQWLAEWEARRG